MHIEEDRAATAAMKAKRKRLIEKRAKLWSDQNKLHRSDSPGDVEFSALPENVNYFILYTVSGPAVYVVYYQHRLFYRTMILDPPWPRFPTLALHRCR